MFRISCVFVFVVLIFGIIFSGAVCVWASGGAVETPVPPVRSGLGHEQHHGGRLQ